MSLPPPSMGVPITQIQFPHSPSPVPSMSSILGGSCPAPSQAMPSAPMFYNPPQPHIPPEPGHPTVPRYQKLSFPTYDGKDDPLGWLNKCEQFFRGQQTRHADWV
jgi:hypothetical protein